jgi:hypothetical protein
MPRIFSLFKSLFASFGQSAVMDRAVFVEPVGFSGEPPGTRTQGPRLKSSNRPFLVCARYCVWFPQ